MSGPRARRGLGVIEPYARPGGARINLADNTSRWGVAPSAAEVLRHAADVVGYPEPYAESLKDAVARYLGVRPDQVTTGCGSDGVLDAALRAFGDPGDRVAIPEPTFPMPATFARANALEPVFVDLGPAYEPDLDAVAAIGARIVYLCSPNNPLGTPCSAGLVAAIARATDGLVIVDEAYAEYADASLVPLIAECRNLLVVRTMSKAFGLAGLRVGYAVGDAGVIRDVERSRGPYQVSALGVAAARAALDCDRDWVRDRATLVRAERALLAERLRARSLDPIPSAGNFVLVPVPRARILADEMRSYGVAVRAYDALRPVSPALANAGGSAIRVTVGPREEMDAAVDALDVARWMTCA